MKNILARVQVGKFIWALSLSLYGATASLCAAQTAAGSAATTVGWVSSGQDLTNLRFQPDETAINASNVNRLTVKWAFTTGNNVSATPTVSGNTVYFPD